MRPRSIKYYFKEGFTGLFKNRLMTVASIGAVAACIFIVSISVCLIGNLNYVLNQIEENIGIAVFLQDGLDSEKINEISNDVKEIEHVTMVTYISPDEALSDLKKEWGAESILDGFDGENNPLSHSLEISIDGIENQTFVIEKLRGVAGVKNIRNAQAETEILLKLNKGLSITGAVVVFVLAAISVVIIMNTIKISVYTRKNEINIMKFVGATDWFIRWPFIIEGCLIGLIGAALPMGVSWPLYSKIVELVYSYFPFIRNIATLLDGYFIFSKLIPVSLVVGVALGVFGSISSIRKYLKV